MKKSIIIAIIGSAIAYIRKEKKETSKILYPLF